MFEFLRSVGLKPIEWTEAVSYTKDPAPYIGQILKKAFNSAQVVIVLLTGDDIAYLRKEFIRGNDPEYEKRPMPQARLNVLFEAGMAFGYKSKRTVLVQIGEIKPFSDVAGRHIIVLNNSAEKRKELIDRLKLADCNVDINHKLDWLTTGDFEKCVNDLKISEKNIKNSKPERIELNDDEEKILQLLTRRKDEEEYPVPSTDISKTLGITATKTDYYLANMEEIGLIHRTFQINGPPWVYIQTEGVDYLVKNDLL